MLGREAWELGDPSVRAIRGLTNELKLESYWGRQRAVSAKWQRHKSYAKNWLISNWSEEVSGTRAMLGKKKRVVIWGEKRNVTVAWGRIGAEKRFFQLQPRRVNNQSVKRKTENLETMKCLLEATWHKVSGCIEWEVAFYSVPEKHSHLPIGMTDTLMKNFMSF